MKNGGYSEHIGIICQILKQDIFEKNSSMDMWLCEVKLMKMNQFHKWGLNKKPIIDRFFQWSLSKHLSMQ